MTAVAVNAATADHATRVQASTGYYPQLDGLRAMAVLFVLLTHMGSPALPHALQRLFGVGWIGVDAFFVLSGFLITKILLNCKPGLRGFGLFVIRRVLRTWPLYLILLAAAFPVLHYMPSGPHISWVRYFFFLQNYTPGLAASLNPTWSLCVEEHFYFTWPILVFLLPRRALLPVLAAVFAGAPLLRFWGWHHGLTWQLYFETQFHLDGLVAGSCVALLLPWHTARPRLSRRVATALLILGAILTIWRMSGDGTAYGSMYYGHNVVFAYTFLGVTFAALLWLLIHEELPLLVKLFSLGPVRYVGRISYGIYLLHMSVIEALSRGPMQRVLGVWADSLLFMIPLRIGLAVLIASISYRFFESPILRWKERFK